MTFRQHPEMPIQKLPIVAIGGGAIVRHAHFPAYKMAGFPVQSVFDLDHERAKQLALDFDIPLVAQTLEQAIQEAPKNAVFDLATPANAIAGVIRQLPDNAAVLIQKPMGENLEQAKEILDICREKNLKAAVNFQLRYAPYALAANDIIDQGLIGDILDIDVKVWVHTPWALWDFLEKSSRMEIVYHSIHYLDYIRSLVGDPESVKAFTIKHPASPKLHSSRSATLLNYGQDLRAQVVTYHAHDYGIEHQVSEVRIEGTRGAIVFQMGLNMNYPDGAGDWLRYSLKVQSGCDTESHGHRWIDVPLEGSWFPHAFRGTMASVQTWSQDSSYLPSTNVEDAYRTMALVEAAYIDSEQQGTCLSPS